LLNYHVVAMQVFSVMVLLVELSCCSHASVQSYGFVG
jgi:hypothetical protein